MATKFTSAQVVAGADILAAQENAMRLDMLKNAGDYATSTGSANAYLLALDAQISAYVAGDVFKFKANFENTGAATLNVNSIGALTIKKNTSVDLLAGDIKSGQIVYVVYDGTNLQMVNTLIPNHNEELVAAGFDLISGKAVSVESDGQVYPSRITATTLDTAFTADNEELLASAGWSLVNKIAALPPYLDATTGAQKVNIVATSYRGPNNFDYCEATYNITTRAFETPTASDFQGGTPTSSGMSNPVPLTYERCVLVSQENVAAASRVYARVLSGLDGTPSLGTSLQVLTAAVGNYKGAIGVGYSSTKILLLYVDGDALKVLVLTESGGSLSAGSPTTLVASGVTTVEDAQRFGTTAFYLVAYNDGSGEAVICFEFDGTSTFNAGSADSIPAGSSNTQFSVACLSSTKAIAAFMDGTAVTACVIDRSARELTVQTESSTLITNSASNKPLKVIAWDENTAEIQTQYDTNFAGRTLVVRIDESTISAVGTLLEVIGATNTDGTLSLVKATPTIGVRFSIDNGGDYHFLSYRFINTTEAAVGMVNAAYTDADTATVVVAGVVDGLSGLTPGERYYTGMGGTLYTKTEGGESEIGRAISATKLKLII